jgi:DNA-binding transcriptional ArsR family regulator
VSTGAGDAAGVAGAAGAADAAGVAGAGGAASGVDAVFDALADPTRRLLLEQLSAAPAATATELASRLPITRQAVVKHLAALTAAGLLQRQRSGREVHYRLTPEPLSEAVTWMAQVGATWDRRLAALASRLD